jgi:sec-independent protein translocase protein TatA
MKEGVRKIREITLQRRKKMGSIGMPELMVILVIALVVFGAGKLPQIGENLGKAIRNFKSATEKEKIDVTPKKPDEPSGDRFTDANTKRS